MIFISGFFREILEGVPVYNPEDGTRLGESKVAAIGGIQQVIASKVALASVALGENQLPK